MVLALRLHWEIPAPASIVMLLGRPKQLDAARLTSLLAGGTVSGTSPRFAARAQGATFVIHNSAKPYVDDPDLVSQSIAELRLRKAIADHRAWLSMDIVGPVASAQEYRTIARLLAGLVDADCLALYHPPLDQIIPCQPDDPKELNSEDPVKTVFRDADWDRVYPFDQDPRMRAAQYEAWRRFREFETAFANKDGSDFAIKTRMSVGEASEHIWVHVDSITPERIEGRLANDPLDLGDLKYDSKVEVKANSTEDWTFVKDGKSLGRFTPPVMEEIEKEQKLSQFAPLTKFSTNHPR
jgi:uncharacterized protein YegJ (DUF2314 family)